MNKKVSEEHAKLFDALFEGKDNANKQINQDKAILDYKKMTYPYILKVTDKFFDILVNVGVNIIPALIMGIILYKNYNTWFFEDNPLGLTGKIIIAIWSVGAPAVLASGVLFIVLELSRIIIEGFITIVLSIRVKRLIKKNNEMNKRIKDELKKRDASDVNKDETKSAIQVGKTIQPASSIISELYAEFVDDCHLNKTDHIPSFNEWNKYFEYCRTLPGGNDVNVFRTKNHIKFYISWAITKSEEQH